MFSGEFKTISPNIWMLEWLCSKIYVFRRAIYGALLPTSSWGLLQGSSHRHEIISHFATTFAASIYLLSTPSGKNIARKCLHLCTHSREENNVIKSIDYFAHSPHFCYCAEMIYIYLLLFL